MVEMVVDCEVGKMSTKIEVGAKTRTGVKEDMEPCNRAVLKSALAAKTVMQSVYQTPRGRCG